MADPITFAGFNTKLRAAPGTEDRVRDMHIHNSGSHLISCWKLTDEERKIVAETGEVWLSVMEPTDPRTGKLARGPAPVYVSGVPLMMATDPDTGDETVDRSDGEHLVEDARRFAILHHGQQKYGKEPYAFHLGQVVDTLRRWGAAYPYLIAGWGHDLEEDCFEGLPMEVKRKTVADRLGALPEAMIWACTGTKDTREECLMEQLGKIAEFPPAAVPKTADRVCNMKACIVDGLVWLARIYEGEADRFVEGVRPHLPPEILAELEETVEALREWLETQPQP
jgi:hypothetical protein